MTVKTFFGRISPVLVVGFVLLVLYLLGTEVGGRVQEEVGRFLIFNWK